MTELALKIENSGANVYEVEIAAGKDEISTANNRTLVAISGIRDRMRVLLICAARTARDVSGL